MAKIDKTFNFLCSKILSEGREYENKNRGVKRLQIPSFTLRHSFSDGFPAITSKKLFFKSIIGELIWFLRGDNDVTYLNDNGIKIWNKDAYNWYVKDCKRLNKEPISFEDFEKMGMGSVGQNYSVQWRNFNGNTDQIKNLIKDMKSDIMSSRLKVNAWNPSEIFMTALPPCHSEFQVIGVPLNGNERRLIAGISEDEWIDIQEKDLELEALEGIPEFGFELHWNQRSVDVFLGLPFNIASYGALAKILEFMTGYPALAIEGTLKCVHFYDNQYDAASKLVKSDVEKHKESTLFIESEEFDKHWDIDDFFNHLKINQFVLKNYTCEEPMKVDMLAPKEC